MDVTGARKLSIVETPEVPDGWGALVQEADGASYCCLPEWRAIMEEEFGHRFRFLSAWGAGGTLRGGLPLVEVRSLLFGHYLVSMPFLNYGGPLGDAHACRALVERAVELAEQGSVDLLELRTRHRIEQPHPVNERKVTVLLDLPSEPEVLWENGLRSKVRSQVRRPIKEGMKVRHGPDQIAPFYAVFARNMRDLGTPVLPRSLFQRLCEEFGEKVWFACVYAEDEPVAGGCGFAWGGEFELTWASSLRNWSREAPNMLLYWSLMERAIEEGIGVFNFGRCTPGGGTHRFKRQWGGRDQALPWIQVAPDGEAMSTPNPEQSKYRAAIEVWSRLPVAVTRWVGPWLARRIP